MLSQRRGHTTIRNHILRSFAASDLSCILPFLQFVALKERSILEEPKRLVEHVTFIESGAVSLRTLTTGSVLETAMVGCRGAVGASVALGAYKSMHQSIVLAHGSAFRVPVDDLRRLMNEHPQIREHLLQYVQSLFIHSTQVALCGVRHQLEARLACWICIACDALESDVLSITHESLSIILGLRRASLTESLIRLDEQGLIRKTRGFLQVIERGRLQQRACSCYSVIANAYAFAQPPMVGGTDLANPVFPRP